MRPPKRALQPPLLRLTTAIVRATVSPARTIATQGKVYIAIGVMQVVLSIVAFVAAPGQISSSPSTWYLIGYAAFGAAFVVLGTVLVLRSRRSKRATIDPPA